MRSLDSGDGTYGGNWQNQILSPSIGKNPGGAISQGNGCSSKGRKYPHRKRSESENECPTEQSPEQSTGQQENTKFDGAISTESYMEYFYSLRAKEDKGLCGE